MEFKTSSDSVTKLLGALAAAKKDFGKVSKKQENTFFKKDGKNSKYADLNAYLFATEDILEANGLIITQLAGSKEGHAGIITILFHVESGEYLQSELLLPLDRVTAQGAGSAITYARRYAYAAILGLAAEDDDGNAASGVSSQSGQLKSVPVKPAPQSNPKQPFKPVPASIPDVSSDFKATDGDLPSELFEKRGENSASTAQSTSSIESSIPTPEEQQKYYDRAGELIKELETLGLKHARAKVKKFILARAGVTDLAKVTHLGWEQSFAIRNFKPEEWVAVLEETIGKEATA